jgi:hypothetical protein
MATISVPVEIPSKTRAFAGNRTLGATRAVESTAPSLLKNLERHANGDVGAISRQRNSAAEGGVKVKGQAGASSQRP